MAVLGLVLLAYGVSPPADLQATQAPRISLDMVTSGNSYDDATNTMTVGSVDNCLTTDLPGNNGQHNHTAHLVVQDVEDLVGWQARLNYDGGRMRPSNVNFTPFTDGNTGQNVSFLNLPLEGGSHRSLVAAQTIPPQAAGPQTALVGAVYGGAQGSAVSPDTPAKATPDDTSYSAPSGGVLAAVNLQVLAGQAEMPGLYIDLDDADPNPPGSEIVVFTGSGTTSVSLPESDLGDGFHGEGVPCVPVAPPAVPLPPPAPSAGASAQSASPDSDTDGFSDSLEPAVGTDPMRPCGIDGWPPDIDNDTFVDTADMAPLTSNFGNAVPPAQARYDISDPPSGFVDTVDLAAMTSRFGTQCASSEALLAMRGCRTDPTHRWAIAISGAGGTVQGTRVWTFTPSGGWSVEKPYSFWGEQAWILRDETGRGLEAGFYSGWFPRGPINNWTDDLIAYWFIETDTPRENWGPKDPFGALEQNKVPAGNWAMLDAVNNGGPSRVWGYTFFARNVDGTPYDANAGYLYPMLHNTGQGEVLYGYAPTKFKTWMSNGAGEGFAGLWTDSQNPGLYTGWYAWGEDPVLDCRNPPYWVKRYGGNAFSNGGYGEPP